MNASLRPLEYAITGAAALIGKVIDIDEWARMAQIPNRKGPGVLDGAAVSRILNIHGKSWDPVLFRKIETVTAVAAAALDSAHLRAADVDAALVVTCSPYETMLDQDSFRILRALGVPDHVAPMQLSAGCAGLARAASVASILNAENILVLTYSTPSLVTGDGHGSINPNYLHNTLHPLGPPSGPLPGSSPTRRRPWSSAGNRGRRGPCSTRATPSRSVTSRPSPTR